MVSWQSLVNDFDELIEDSKYETVKAFMGNSSALSDLVQKELKRLEAGSAEQDALASLGGLRCICVFAVHMSWDQAHFGQAQGEMGGGQDSFARMEADCHDFAFNR